VYYEDLAGRLYGLVIRLSDRLPADQVQWLHHVTEVGEYGLALEDMAGMWPTARWPSPIRSAATCWPWSARDRPPRKGGGRSGWPGPGR